eukprot:6678614-Prymnesium_polylepis.1
MVSQRSSRADFEDAALCWRTEAQSRQCLCVEDAIVRGSAAGMHWLLHIDADECLLPQSSHLWTFFAALPPHVEQ